MVRENRGEMRTKVKGLAMGIFAGLYARVSTNDHEQTVALQNRAMRDYAAGRSMRSAACMVRLFVLYVSMNSALLPAEIEKPIWAKNAVPIGGCYGDVGHRMPSPDGKVIVELQCHPPTGDNDPVPYLHVRTVAGNWHDVELEEGAHEVLWSPDSKAFLVNGGTSSYAGFFVSVYLVSTNGIQKLQVTDAVQADMVKTFPPL